MKAKRRIAWLIILFAAVWALLSGEETKAAESKVRVLEVTRGVYDGAAGDLAPGPQEDGENFGRIIRKAYGESCVEIVVKDKEGVTTVEGVQEVIRDTFAGAGDEDINYFYYSGHGAQTGLFLGSNEIMSAKELADGFEGIKGTNILVMDCCYSGGMASRSVSAVSGAESFVDSFVDQFQTAVSGGDKTARSALTNARFKLLMASSAEELSWQMSFGENIELGGFTTTLCYGCGIDPGKVLEETGFDLNVASADYNRNGEISLSEIRRYVENTYHYASNHVRSYPAEDSGRFLPVSAEKVPQISFESVSVEIDQNTQKERAGVRFYASTPVAVDYAIYKSSGELLANLGFSGIHYAEALPDYSDISRIAFKENVLVSPPDANGGKLLISLEGYEAGKYYLLIQTEGQDLRYMLPFTVAEGESQELKENFQLVLGGEHYSEKVFELEEGNEMLIKADFGTTTDPEETPPYLSCYIYDGNDLDAESDAPVYPVRILGEKELMQIVPTEYEEGSNILKKGNCYREFCWDGRDDDGQIVPDGIYVVRVIATGAVEDEKVEAFNVRKPAVQAEVTELALSRAEIHLPNTSEEEKEDITFGVNCDGTVSVTIRQTGDTGNEEVRTLLEGERVIGHRRYMVSWDGIISGGGVAASGSYCVTVTFTPDGEMPPADRESDVITVVTDTFQPVLEVPEEWKAEFAEGEESVVLLNYVLNYATYVNAVLYDEKEEPVAVLASGLEVESGTQQISWDGKDTEGNFVKSGVYSLVLEVWNPVTGEMETLVDGAKIAVSGLETEPEQKPEPEKEEPGEQGTGQDGKPNLPNEVLPQGISVGIGEKTVKKITVGMKEKVQLKAVISPANAVSQSVTYASSNTKVAAVSASGKVTAKKAGKAVITVTTANGRKASVAVTVKQAPKKITFSAKSKTLKVKKTYKAKVKFPAKTASYKLTFTSSKKSVASVDASGKIRALKKGKAVITAKTFNGKKARITIIVK